MNQVLKIHQINIFDEIIMNIQVISLTDKIK